MMKSEWAVEHFAYRKENGIKTLLARDIIVYGGNSGRRLEMRKMARAFARNRKWPYYKCRVSGGAK